MMELADNNAGKLENKQKFEEFEPHWFTLESNDKLIIQENQAPLSVNFLKLIKTLSIILIPFVIFAILVSNRLFGVYFYIIFISLLFIGYWYYKERKIEWIFDKTNHIIRHHKISPTFKIFCTTNLSEIQSIIYSEPYEYHFRTHKILLRLKNKKKFTIYSGMNRNACIKLGIKIAKFLK